MFVDSLHETVSGVSPFFKVGFLLVLILIAAISVLLIQAMPTLFDIIAAPCILAVGVVMGRKSRNWF